MTTSSEDSFRIPMALGDLSARLKLLEERQHQTDLSGTRVISELRDEIKENTKKFDAVIESLEKMVREHREDVDVKIQLAVEKLDKIGESKYVSKLEFSNLDKKLDGLTSKLTFIWSALIIVGVALNWLVEHPGILQALGAK